MAFGYCPDCLTRIDMTRRPTLGRTVTCQCCSVVLRVADLNPLQLDWATEAADENWEEDWEVELARA
jgi:lysine biosynthesis protein LysW